MISRHDLAPSVGPFIAYTRALAVVAAAPVLYCMPPGLRLPAEDEEHDVPVGRSALQ
jgi:hypothetical protein